MFEQATTSTEKAVSNLYLFLKRICEKPSNYADDKELLHALSRQDRLGSYESKKYDVQKSSRSSIERVSSRLLIDGYPAFDSLRREALAALKAASSAAAMEKKLRRKRADYQQEATQQVHLANRRLVDCWHLTSALIKAIHEGRNIAMMANAPELDQHWERSEKLILSMMSLSKKLVVQEASKEQRFIETLREYSRDD